MLAARGALIACSTVATLAVARFVWGEPWAHARALMFTVLMTAHLLYAFIARRPNRGLASNPWLLLAVGGGILLQLAVVTWPPVRELFGTASLTLREWALVAVAGIAPIGAMRAWSGKRRNGPEPDLRGGTIGPLGPGHWAPLGWTGALRCLPLRTRC
jgi:magnesium-transporting ATPase (P-type)